MQADGAIAQTALGSNFDVIQTAGTTSIGNSKNAVDADSTATTNTLPLRIYDFYDGPDSTIGDAFTMRFSFLMLAMRTRTPLAYKE